MLAALAVVLVLWRSAGSVRDDRGPVHVHGLGVNPADRALYVATHTGLYRLVPGAERAERVTESHQDTMGFTVVGPDHFLGSGHPDLRDDLPSHLGLVESRNAGRTWEPVSLLGEADFHVLRFGGDRVYGYDVAHERLLVSSDLGRSWEERRAPGSLVDLATDPADDERLVATTSEGLFGSADGGKTWKRSTAHVGLLAWPSSDRLLMVDAAGRVFVSGDGGRALEEVGAAGGEPAAVASAGLRELFVALHDGTIRTSTDGGATWTVRSTP